MKTIYHLSLLAIFSLSLSACQSGMRAQPDEAPQAVEPVQSLEDDGDIEAQPTLENIDFSIYSHLDPSHLIHPGLLKEAKLYFFLNQAKLTNKSVMSVVDFSLPSTAKRFFVVSMKTGKVWSFYVSHGQGSDKDHDGVAEKFSNRPNSNASSLGAFLATDPYEGEHGYSLRLEGLSASNSNAKERNVVIHGAKYVRNAGVVQGRSWGCFALPIEQNKAIINIIKGRSLLYAGLGKTTN